MGVGRGERQSRVTGGQTLQDWCGTSSVKLVRRLILETRSCADVANCHQQAVIHNALFHCACTSNKRDIA